MKQINKLSKYIPDGCEFCKHLNCYHYKANGKRFGCAKDYNLSTMRDDYDCPSYESDR